MVVFLALGAFRGARNYLPILQLLCTPTKHKKSNTDNNEDRSGLRTSINRATIFRGVGLVTFSRIYCQTWRQNRVR